MAYSKQTWDTTSYVNPTRMNHIEDGIESASTATGTEYSSGVSVKDNLDGITITGITSNTYVVGSFSVVAFKVGKLAVINIKEITFNANVPDADYVILRNLPIPTTNIEFPLTKLGGSGDVSKRLRLNTKGELQNWYSVLNSGETLFGTLVYQIA